MTRILRIDPRGRRAARPRCPICRAPAVERFAPFCSRRCADVDLARWLDGRYVLPGEERAPTADDEGDD